LSTKSEPGAVKVLFASCSVDLIPRILERMRTVLPELPLVVVSEGPGTTPKLKARLMATGQAGTFGERGERISAAVEDTPNGSRELLARINAVLRRSTPSGVDELIEFEGLVLDQASHRVMVGPRTVGLGPTEYRMLEFFMTHPERVYTRDQLLDRIWGGNVYVEERTIDVHIRRLRKALEEFGYDRFVQTVRGSGYRFSARTV